jgi:putative flippase GtrA
VTRWRALRGRFVELVRFGLVGLVCFALDIGVLVALRTWTPLPLAVDAGIGFGVAALATFVASRQWVFAEASRGARPHTALARYVLLIGAGLLFTAAAVPLLATAGLDYRVAKLAASGVVALGNFVVMPRWVFR